MVSAVMVSANQLVCKAPAEKSYTVTVTYDKVTFSDSVSILIVSSDCFLCDPDTLTCVPRQVSVVKRGDQTLLQGRVEHQRRSKCKNFSSVTNVNRAKIEVFGKEIPEIRV